MALQVDQAPCFDWARLNQYKHNSHLEVYPHSTGQRQSVSAAKRSCAHLRCWVPPGSQPASGVSPERLLGRLAGVSDGQSDPSRPSSGDDSSASSGAPRGIRWLDREVQHGNVSEEKLVGGEGRPPIKTDRLLRSYSKKASKSKRLWWRVAARTVAGVACVAAGVPTASTGIGILLTCIRTGTVFTSGALTFTGVKMVVTGVGQLQKARNEDAPAIERGTAARAWAIVIASTACMSTTAALLPVFERAVRLYMRLVRFARAHADDVRFHLQSRKLLVHSADQVERAARTVFGGALTETIQEQIDAAVDLTEKVSQGMVTDVSSEEARRVLAALSFKITCAYTFCGAVFLVPTVVNFLIAPPIARRGMKVLFVTRRRYKDWEGRVIKKAGPRFGPCLAASAKVALVLMAAKPFGLMGERLARIPIVRVGLDDGLMRFALPFMPRKVEVKPVPSVDNGTSSNIPLVARWFLQ